MTRSKQRDSVHNRRHFRRAGEFHPHDDANYGERSRTVEVDSASNRFCRSRLLVCNKLTHVSLPALDPEVRPYFQDVLDHVRRVETRVGGLREILTSVFEAANLLEQQRQGRRRRNRSRPFDFSVIETF